MLTKNAAFDITSGMNQANRILARFKTKGITQQTLAKSLGCRQSVISGWKTRGVIPPPQQAKVFAAAVLHGVDISEADFFVAHSDQRMAS